MIREESSSTKLRILFNASVKSSSKNPSLNDCLHIGPSLCPANLDILLCFKQKRAAVISDIKHAFLNININAADCNIPGFLWLNSIEEENPSIVVYRFRTVTFGVGPSPFLMNATLGHHLDKNAEKKPELVEMDDDTAFTFYKKVKTVFS